jgi:hypothetical protein
LNRGRLAYQDQKSGLESVLGIGFVSKNAPDDSKHHRAVPEEQGFKGRLVVLAQKALQQFAICKARLALALQ